MSPTQLKMQPIIHLEGKTGYLPRPYPVLPSKCIAGCIFNSVGVEFIVTRKIPCGLDFFLSKFQKNNKDHPLLAEIAREDASVLSFRSR
jgi:hypothetical protein